MTLELNPLTVEFILQKMESLTKEVMSFSVWEHQLIAKKIGEFQAYKELLDNSGFESYGLKFKVIMPTKDEWEKSLPDEDEKE